MNAELRTTLYGQKQLDCVMDAMAATIASKLIGVERVSLVGVLRRGAPWMLSASTCRSNGTQMT